MQSSPVTSSFADEKYRPCSKMVECEELAPKWESLVCPNEPREIVEACLASLLQSFNDQVGHGSQDSLMNSRCMNNPKTPKEVAESCVDSLFHNFDDLVGGEFRGKSSCSIPVSKKSSETTSKDLRLVNWKRWISIREQQSRKIHKSTYRSPNSMLLNLNSNVCRNLVKQKEVMEKCIAKADLNFWKMPLKSREGLFLTIPKSERTIVPEIEFTLTPNLTLKEQNISTSNNENSVVKMLKHKVKEENCLFQPEMDQIALKGGDVWLINDKNASIESALSSDYPKCEDEESCEFPKCEDEESGESELLTQMLIIGGCRFDPNYKVTEVKLMFEAFKLQTNTQSLEFKNCGDIAINVTLKKDVCCKASVSGSFCFVESTFRIIPDEVRNVLFGFHPIKAGSSRLRLIVNCDPSFGKICIDLVGICQKKTACELPKLVTNHGKASTELKSLKKKLKDDEEERFILMNPNLVFDPDCIQNLNQIYNEISSSEDNWNFDTKDLYQRILKVENLELMQDFLQIISRIHAGERTITVKEEKLTKSSLAKSVLSTFVEKLVDTASEANEVENIEQLNKANFLIAIDKMICLFES